MPQEKKFKCPHCEAWIENVKYFCYTSGKEWGSAFINEDGEFDDHNSDDSETTDSNDYEYTCPECGASLGQQDFRQQTGEITPPTPIINEDNQPIHTQEDVKSKLLATRNGSYLPDNNEYTTCPKCKKINFVQYDEHSYVCTKCNRTIKTKRITRE